MARRVGNIVLGIIFAVLGWVVRAGALELIFLRDVLGDSDLYRYISDRNTALILVGIGGMIILSNLLPEKTDTKESAAGRVCKEQRRGENGHN